MVVIANGYKMDCIPMIVGTSQAFLDYDWGNLGHLPHDLTFKKLREKPWNLNDP